MKSGIYDTFGSKLEPKAFWEYLNSAETGKPCLALVGAGGKTSALYHLAEGFAKEGKRVLVTTSTHILEPASEIAAGTPEEVERIWSQGRPAVIGEPTEAIAQRQQPKAITGKPGTECMRKWGSPKKELFLKAYERADLVLIEADGSRQKPCKVPREYEPAIPREVTHILLVFGLSALGKTIEEASYPPGLVADILGTKENHVLREEDMIFLINHYLQHLKVRFRGPILVLLNQADTRGQYDQALRVSRGLSVPVLLSKLSPEP